MLTITQRIALGYQPGAHSPEAEAIDVGIAQAHPCAKFGDPMHYDGPQWAHRTRGPGRLQPLRPPHQLLSPLAPGRHPLAGAHCFCERRPRMC